MIIHFDGSDLLILNEDVDFILFFQRNNNQEINYNQDVNINFKQLGTRIKLFG